MRGINYTIKPSYAWLVAISGCRSMRKMLFSLIHRCLFAGNPLMVNFVAIFFPVSKRGREDN